MEEHPVDEAAVDVVLMVSRALVAVATMSLGAAAEDTTLAQYRALVVLASRGPQRMAGLAATLAVMPSTAGRMCDILVRKGLTCPQRARADRRAVQVSVTAAGLQVASEVTARRRELIAGILGKLPPGSSQRSPMCCRHSPGPPERSPAVCGPPIPPAPSRRSR